MSKGLHKLWFKRSNGEEVFLTMVDSKEELFARINEFLAEKNYHAPYMRTWLNDDDTRTIIDVGSHTEFFIYDDVLVW